MSPTMVHVAPIYGLTVSEAAKVILFLGSFACDRGCGSGAWLSSRLTARAMYRLLTEAAKIVLNWPDAYFEMLDRLSAAEHRSRTGVEYDFSNFYETLTKSFDPQRFAFLHKGFATFLENHWAGGFLSNKNTRTGSTKSKKFLTLPQAAKSLSVRRRTVLRLASLGYVENLQLTMRTRTLTLVTRSSLARYSDIRDDYLSFQETCALLGLSEKALRGLIAKGIISRETCPKINRSRPTAFKTSHVEALMRKIPKAIERRVETNGILSFRQAERRLSASGYSVADLIEMTIEKKLSIAMIDSNETGFRRCCFERRQIQELIDSRPIAPADWKTLPQTANLLHLKEQVVYQLATKGLLKCKKQKCRGRPVSLIAAAEVERFKQSFCSASAAAKRYGSSPKKLVADFAKRGIRPICGPAVDGTRQYFYRKADLVSAGLDEGKQ